MTASDEPVRFGGRCQCGDVSYEIHAEPVRVGQCCCADCRKASGTGHVTIAFFPSDAVTIEGALAGYDSVADSGNTVTRLFCPRCGSRMLIRNTGRPGLEGITVGTMDDAEAMKPQAAVFVSENYDWDLLDPDLPKFDEMPPAR